LSRISRGGDCRLKIIYAQPLKDWPEQPIGMVTVNGSIPFRIGKTLANSAVFFVGAGKGDFFGKNTVVPKESRETADM